MLGRKMRGRTKEEHEELQDLDPRGSPHLEEKVIGGYVDLDLLSLFPQERARIIGGLRVSKLEEGQQWGKKTS